ncbi:protein-lysine methyltransferase METTL21E-like isoform X3 [Bufo gargarizans]|uniref:protein-lysine methyltransferase METTL21E-like isoform X3 n=1 Tax=Bufo gargarizans TaxID=30331 RepID=UPI001CF34CA9|nr:protein-lysine methyltransferase METTL21E-like isoform X3 [Bufo gargarizans]
MADEHEGHENDEIIVPQIMERRYVPASLKSVAWEGFNFVGHEIKIVESTDLYGAFVWPSALVLCYFLEKHGKQLCIEDKNIIEIGSGTGLVAIVACLLEIETHQTRQHFSSLQQSNFGAQVVATDLEELIGNLQYNILRNTKMKSDVVYNHPYLEELLETLDHLCSENSTILWVMRFRKENTLQENAFIQKFQKLFDMEVIFDLPSLSIKLYRARRHNQQK